MILAFILHEYWYESPVTHPPGILVPSSPRQAAITEIRAWAKDEYQIRALAQFSIEARVLGKERYWLDRAADLSPIDLALGWGPRSDQKVLEQLDISQSGRRYFWWARHLPLPAKEINALPTPFAESCRDFAKSRISATGQPTQECLFFVTTSSCFFK